MDSGGRAALQEAQGSEAFRVYIGLGFTIEDKGLWISVVEIQNVGVYGPYSVEWSSFKRILHRLL